ncbi:MAG TPA: hypothetical protein PLL59_10145, partial [Chitinophagales bacterium]|nr:hypothetical protein [Chitinophagales bacterium]
MKKISLLSILILIIVFTFSYCNRKANASNGNSGTERTAQLVTLSKNGITLTELYSPETFTDATLLQSTNAGATELDS